VQYVTAIHDRGIADIRTTSGEAFTGDVVDVGKHLRPNWRRGRIVLFVEPPAAPGSPWQAAKVK
jgi:hypothetical protein